MGKIAEDCKVLIEAKCHGNGWQILELAIQPDHVHLFVWVWPTVSAAEVVKRDAKALLRMNSGGGIRSLESCLRPGRGAISLLQPGMSAATRSSDIIAAQKGL